MDADLPFDRVHRSRRAQRPAHLLQVVVRVSARAVLVDPLDDNRVRSDQVHERRRDDTGGDPDLPARANARAAPGRRRCGAAGGTDPRYDVRDLDRSRGARVSLVRALLVVDRARPDDEAATRLCDCDRGHDRRRADPLAAVRHRSRLVRDRVRRDLVQRAPRARDAGRMEPERLHRSDRALRRRDDPLQSRRTATRADLAGLDAVPEEPHARPRAESRRSP